MPAPHSRLHPFAVAFLLLACSTPSQPPAAAARKTTVAVIGASVSAGFADRITSNDADRNQTLRLAAVLAAVWPKERAEVRSFADLLMFLDADGKGAPQVERARKLAPDLVVGVDFLFWFGYGGIDDRWTPDGGDAGSDAGAGAGSGGGGGARSARGAKAARLARLARGTALLEQLDCPLVVGDLPDMRDADPRMLPPSVVPSVEELAALNDALRTWAKARPAVAVFPLAEWVRSVRENGDTVEIGGRQVALHPELLLQTDRLHPTRLGVGLLVHRLVPSCKDLLPDAHPLRQDLPGFAELTERIGADVDLDEALAEPAAAQRGGVDKKG